MPYLKKSLLFNLFNIKEIIDSEPESFYFNIPLHNDLFNYYDNLILINKTLVIDDLIVDSLIKRGTLISLFHIIKNKSFTKGTLKFIFNNVIYKEDLLFYKYGLLHFILIQYKDKKQEPADNVCVLANIIWEEMILKLKQERYIPAEGMLNIKGSIWDSEETPKIIDEKMVGDAKQYNDNIERPKINTMILEYIKQNENTCGKIVVDSGLILSARPNILVSTEIVEDVPDVDMELCKEISTILKESQEIEALNKWDSKDSVEGLFDESGFITRNYPEIIYQLELLSTVIKTTDSFFYKRIKANSLLFNKLKEMYPGIKVFHILQSDFKLFIE